jgi:glycosyltransferase involved in cell wall biosynthesis
MTCPRLTIGLPVYNGERFLAESIEALLRQSFTDFELIISDNASTDGTEVISRTFAARDPRVRYVRHPKNLGSAFNHNYTIAQARGEFFKWASDDDLYAPDLLQRAVEALDRRPEIVLAHAWTAFIDESSEIVLIQGYPLNTDVPDAPERFRSLLLTQGGDDIYGVIRTRVLHRIPPHGSFHNADRTFVGELSLYGPFHQVPEPLYFRRDHPGRAERAPGKRPRAVILDPRRANRWQHPGWRLGAEYVLGYVAAIRRAPLSAADKRRCLVYLAIWVAGHLNPLRVRDLSQSPDPAVRARGARSWVNRISRAASDSGHQSTGRRP